MAFVFTFIVLAVTCQFANSVPYDGYVHSAPYGSSYEEHAPIPVPKDPVVRFQTVTETVTNTITVAVKTTSDIWVTDAIQSTVPVVQLKTHRNYVKDDPNTVTSVIRVTARPVVVTTDTSEAYSVKTVVSIYTSFLTTTSTAQFWLPITHYSTSLEVITRPVLSTQVLTQHVTSTLSKAYNTGYEAPTNIHFGNY